ncbi:MAG: hypothetical protein WCA97_02350 [Terriglobales bacterium]|jgi:hypothetical protein
MQNFVFAVLILFLVLPCSGQRPIGGKAKSAIDESGKPNYTITITPPNGPLSLKSPLLIEIYFTNTTTSDIYLESQICHLCTTERILLTKGGKEVETTPFQRMSTGRGLPSDFEELHKQFPHMNAVADGHPSRNGPGVFLKVNLDLRKLYNITEPGQYTITASRIEQTRDEKVVVKSNTVTLDIVP